MRTVADVPGCCDEMSLSELKSNDSTSSLDSSLLLSSKESDLEAAEVLGFAFWFRGARGGAAAMIAKQRRHPDSNFYFSRRLLAVKTAKRNRNQNFGSF